MTVETLAEETRLREVVRRVFGFDALLPHQAEAMQAGLGGRDALVVLATGGGKSLCYQAPALLRDGLTCVVSPLISLMKDQIDGLAASGVPAAMLSSAQDGFELSRVRAGLRDGHFKLLYVAPERLLMPGFFDELVAAGLATLVIDEAHCISHWGHDFRPEYRQIGALRARYPDIPVQAFTATATPQVRRDVVVQLGLVEPLVLVGSCDRPNLTYRFLPRGDVLSQVMSVIARHPGEAGIVYCLRRRDVDDLARDLAAKEVRCVPYHAGLDARVRTKNQERFLAEEVEVVVATIAFGMGIDRSDVRYVVHASLPKGIEQYSQESGRAGRDGLPAECVMFFSARDYHGWRSLMERSAAEAEAAGNARAGADLEGSIARLGTMLSFAGGANCRHRGLAEHFGEPWGGRGPCGACDVCLGELKAVPDAKVLAQKILSCVVRCEQRYGGAHVADVLRGADTQRLRAAGHDRLSTYGLLRESSVREIRHWIDQLVGQDLLRVTSGPYPTLFVTQAGADLLRGNREVALFALPAPSKAAKRKASIAELAADAGAPAPDEGLFERLRALRRRLAAERAVPPYLIFSDRSLAHMAGARPSTPADFLSIKGVGERKAADLGPLFLAEIAAWAAS